MFKFGSLSLSSDKTWSVVCCFDSVQPLLFATSGLSPVLYVAVSGDKVLKNVVRRFHGVVRDVYPYQQIMDFIIAPVRRVVERA